MNIIEASVKTGRALRKTDIGINLLNLHSSVYEKYKKCEPNEYILFNQSVEKETCINNFFAWIISYEKFKYIYDKPNSENANLFKNTAKIVINDGQIKELVETAANMGKIVSKLTDNVLTNKGDNGEIEKSYKVKNTISDLKMSIQRSSFQLYIASKLRNQVETLKISEYDNERRKKEYQPFSSEAIKFIAGRTETNADIKECVERTLLVQNIIGKGIFEGFWGIFSEIEENQILENKILFKGKITEEEFTHNNILMEFKNKKSWLYKLNYKDKKIYVLANSKKIQFLNNIGVESAKINGLVYPEIDVKFFESNIIRE